MTDFVHANARKDLKHDKYIQVTVGVYEHNNWLQLLDMPNPSCKDKEELIFKKTYVNLPIDGTQREVRVTLTERNWHMPMMYYMAVMDCQDQIFQYLGDIKIGKIWLTATMTSGDDHFSYEKQSTITVDTCLLLCFMGLFLMNSFDLVKFQGQFDTVNSPHVYCLIALGLQCAGITCDLVHSVWYKHDGEGLIFFDVLGTILDMVSECVMSLLVLMLANGWYSRFKQYSFDEGFENYSILFMLCLFIHIVFGVFTMIDQDDHHKYHDFHGWQGYCMICAKLVLLAIYAFFYSQNVDLISQKENKRFYQLFIPIGAIYLLSDPFVILSSYILAEYNR